MDDYNYSVFDLAREEKPFHSFPQRLNVGERAPDFALEELESGETVRMASLWRTEVAVLEFGSFT